MNGKRCRQTRWLLTALVAMACIAVVSGLRKAARDQAVPSGQLAASVFAEQRSVGWPTSALQDDRNNRETDAPAVATLTGEAAREQLRKEGQYASLGAAFQAARYAAEKIDPAGVHSRGAEYFAANPKQQLRAWFRPNGIELASSHHTNKGDEPWNLHVRLRGIGRPGTIMESRGRTVRSTGDRIEIAEESGAVTEWYENRRDGLEQGFTLIQSPQGAGPLKVVMAVEGNLRSELISDAGVDSVRFLDVDGKQVVQYSGLKAWDADGRALPAQIALNGHDLALMVEDAGARYPVTIDPIFASAEARLVQNPALSGEFFGYSVALSGDTALIGVVDNDTPAGTSAGSVYVFVRTGTRWNQQAKLVASDRAPGDGFGSSVTVSGGTAVIGARYSDTTGGADAGSAYVFVRSGTSWSQQAKLVANDGAAGDEFGNSVSLSGSTALVGATSSDTTQGTNAGSAYVFVRSGTTWSQQAKLTASDGAASDVFGGSVALSGETALVGARLDDNARGSNAGSAYVFIRSGTTWSQQAKLTASDSVDGDRFGGSVALSGTTALIGAEDANSAYVFVRSGTTWSQQAKLAGSFLDDLFGCSVALSGNTAVIGAEGTEVDGFALTGSAYVFVRSGTTWSQQAYLLAGDGDGRFGSAVAVSSNTALVGAPSVVEGPGSSHIFVRSGTTWSQQIKLTADNTASLDQLGSSVALDGDTALVGAANDDTPGGVDAGTVHIFVREGTSWRRQGRLNASDGADGDFFGSSMALSGNTALVGAMFADATSAENAGSAYVFVRDGISWSQQAKFTASDPTSNGFFGDSVSLSGETALVGAEGSRAAYAFVRNGSTWSQQAKLTTNDTTANSFGASVALSENTALIGSTYNSDTNAGSAYVFKRVGTFWSQQAKLTASDATPFNGFGSAVALNGTTALVGAFGTNTAAGANAGSAYIFVGDLNIWTQQAKLTASDAAAKDNLGFSVALSGDIAVLGAAGDLEIEGLPGSAYVFARSEQSWTQQAKLTAGVDRASAVRFGSAVALSNNTALVGSYLDDTAGLDAGSAYVFLLSEIPEIVSQPLSQTVVPGTSVTFYVKANGSAPLRYQWRRNGFEIAGANGPSLTIQVPSQAPFTVSEGTYDAVISNLGGTATSAAAVLRVNALSRFIRDFRDLPSLPPEAGGSILVNLGPDELLTRSGIKPAWRFVGEQEWRPADARAVPLGGLTNGNREIEFRPVPGYYQPLREPVSIRSGELVKVEREYYPNTGAETGGALSVTLLPSGLAGVQWRLLGDDTGSWQNSGASLSNLPVGVYLIEFREVAGYATPRPISVTVTETGTIPTSPTATYFLPDASVGKLGLETRVVGFDAIVASGTTVSPYAFVGQLRSDSGAGTGFAVRERVVATAAHVVFDDGTLSVVTGLQWLFQRERGTYEPVPQIPRGSYIHSGYSAARQRPGVVPGQSTAESQNFDVAAVWFFEKDDADRPQDPKAARGGYGGYLASDAVDNEWLKSDRLKTLVGYPLDGIPVQNQGRMHATPPENIEFERVPGTDAEGNAYRTYFTKDITSRGGNSGGPICVQYDNDSYYPAAVYLGGTSQTRVRAIDSDVIALFDAAELSSRTGKDNNQSGIAQPNNLLAAPKISSLTVTLEPKEARDKGAGWRLGKGAFLASGASLPFIPPGDRYLLNFDSIEGFHTPDPLPITVAEGANSKTVTYIRKVPPEITGSNMTRAMRRRPFTYKIPAANLPTQFTASGLQGSDFSLDAATGIISGTPQSIGTVRVIVVAQNSAGASEPFELTIVVSEPRQLVVQTDPERGSVAVTPKRANNIYGFGETVTLIAKPKAPAFLFGGWQFDGATPSSFTTAKTTFVVPDAGNSGDPDSIVATATFVPNPFLTRLGSYFGLLTGTDNAPAGNMSVSVNQLGAFSLKALVLGRSYSLKGTLDSNGHFDGVIIRRGLLPITVGLDLDTNAAEPRLVGTITADGQTFGLDAARAVFSKNNRAPAEGSHTLALLRDATKTNPATYPFGHGYALVTVSAAGGIRASGQLGDGTAFSAGGVFAADQSWALFVQPYSKQGLLAGVLTFTDHAAPDIDEITGTFTWQKPPAKRGAYAGGFTGVITVAGSRYIPPLRGSAALNITDWNLLLGDADVLNTPTSVTATLSELNRFRLTGTASVTTSLQINPATGLLSGKFQPDGTKAVPFKGALLQRQRFGRGVFALPNRTGPVTLDPP